MKCSTFLSTSGILGILFGLAFLLAPEVIGPLYGIPPEPHTLMANRYFGGTLLWVGLVSWLARGVRDDLACVPRLRRAQWVTLWDWSLVRGLPSPVCKMQWRGVRPLSMRCFFLVPYISSVRLYNARDSGKGGAA